MAVRPAHRLTRPWTRRWRAAALPAIAGLLMLLLACSKSSSGSSPTEPSSPAPSTSNVTGTWSGTAADSSGPGQMTWQLSQSGASFSGTLTMAGATPAGTTVTGRGSVSGTVSGTTLQFTITVLAGGFDSPYTSCTVDASGTATLSASSLTGTYAGSSSCGGAITAGQLALTRQ